MAKASGFGDNAYVAGFDLSGDITTMKTVRGGPMALDDTGISKSAFERIGGLRTGEISFTTWWNSVGSHLALKGLPLTDSHAMYCRGTSIGSPAACMVARQVDYNPTRRPDGGLTADVQCLSDSYGLEWGQLLTAGLRTDTGATTGTTQDDAAATAFGLQAYLQVISFVGTDVTITIQDSANDSAYTALASGAFTQVTAGPTFERIATANNATVRRYLRVYTSTTGGFSSLVFAVAYVRNAIAGQVF